MLQFNHLAHAGGEGPKRLPLARLHPTPSFVDGVSREREQEQRIYACELIQQAGWLLQLHQVTTATGQVLLQRFYHNESMKEFDVRFVAMGALFLASKVEENMRAPRQMLSVFYRILQPHRPPLEISSKLYWELKEGMFQAEMHILRSLGFRVNITHPHKFLLMYARTLDLPASALQFAWNSANDLLKTTVVIRWVQAPWVVASACILHAVREAGLSLPPRWYVLFDSTMAEMLEILGELAELYSRTSPARWHPIEGASIPYGFDQMPLDSIPASPSTRKVQRQDRRDSRDPDRSPERATSRRRSRSPVRRRSPRRSRSRTPPRSSRSSRDSRRDYRSRSRERYDRRRDRR